MCRVTDVQQIGILRSDFRVLYNPILNYPKCCTHSAVNHALKIQPTEKVKITALFASDS